MGFPSRKPEKHPRNTMAWDGEKSYKNRGEKLGASVEGGPFLRRIPINHHLQGEKLIGSPPKSKDDDFKFHLSFQASSHDGNCSLQKKAG